MPTLAFSQNVNSTAANTSTLTTSSFTPDAGDIIVVKGARENSTGGGLGVPTDSQGNTYTQRHITTINAQTWIWSAVAASSSSMTVSVTVGTACWHSITVEDWTSANLDASPAINSTVNGSGFPLATLTTTQANSAVSWVNADFAAISPSSRLYNTSSAVPVEDGLHDESGPTAYVAYYAYQTAASAGSQIFGVSSPGGQSWSLTGMEVLDIPGPSAPEDPNQAEPIILWQ